MRLIAVTDDDFHALDSGLDDVHAVQTLKVGQHSKRLLLIRAVLDHAADAWPAEHRTAGVEQAFRLLDTVQRRASRVVTDVLLDPQVGGWAAHALRQMNVRRGDGETIVAVLRFLGAIAASAALRAGLEFEVSVPVHAGHVILPTLGSARVPGARPATGASVRCADGVTWVTCGLVTLRLPVDLARDVGGWHPLPRLSAARDGLSLTVALDDVGPYRRYDGLTPAEHLPVEVVARWRRRFDDAWTLLVRYHLRFARSISAGLSSIVPLAASGRRGVSATSPDAFGAAAVSLPDQATELAVALVHEFQHSKLSALLDVVPLVARSDDLLYAPWRDDPRPVAGLLQGCYAHFAIAGFWRMQRHVSVGGEASVAHFEFARWRTQTRHAATTLLASGALRSMGHRFVGDMLGPLDRWRSEPVPLRPLRAARLAALDHEVSWRLRNLHPNDVAVRAFARAWDAGESRPMGRRVEAAVVPGDFAPSDGLRNGLWRHYLRGTGPFERRQPLTMRPEDEVDMAPSTDVSLVVGDYDDAADGYRAQIAVDPSDIAAWSGLASARSMMRRASGIALAHRPEIVLAVHREVQSTTGRVPDPDALAAWLAPVVTRP